jgi:hypothetical protein
MSEKDIIFGRYGNLDIGETDKGKDNGKEYPEIAMEVGKFVREVGQGIWHCKVHHLPVSPLVKVCLYTLDGQYIGAQSFASSCFGYEPSEAVIKEIGSYCAGTAMTCILLALSPTPAFWTVLAIGLAGATASFAYSELIKMAWKFSKDHHLGAGKSVYATPNIEGQEFIKSYQGQFRKVRTKRTGRSSLGDAMPVDLFDSRQATRENYVGITTNDFGSDIKWLIKLK